MNKSRSLTRGYILAAIAGAVAGGLAAAIATRAIPGIVSRLAPDAMRNAMMRMGGEGCDPEAM